MTYTELIGQNIQGVYEKGIATKILQHMGRIRNASDIAQARRWPMELMQNAGDLAYKEENRRVGIRLRLERDKMVFSHTGKPFRVKDILSIINQVSSKNPGEGVGQFGTGFITTYQLSEKVEIRSVLKEEGLPYRAFHVTLDRSGKSQEELHDAIERNMRQLEAADSGEELTVFDKSEFHTSFVYRLENENSRKIARTGMRDLRDTILYIMLFSDNIGRVELEFADNSLGGQEEHLVYERGDESQVGAWMKDMVILESGNPHFLRYMSGNGITLAVEYDREKGYLPISEQTPRLFIDFPLIGAENFPFPVVVNSRKLQPNEPRSGISLVDLEQSLDARVNKDVMNTAVAMYKTFLTEMVRDGMGGIENVIRIPKYQHNKEWSENWVKRQLYGIICAHIACQPIFRTREGMQSLNCQRLCLLNAADGKELQEMIGLGESIDGILTPLGEVDWYAALCTYDDAAKRSISLKDILEKANDWRRNGKIRGEILAWSQKLYDVGMANPETEPLIRTGGAAIFLNQRADDKEFHTALEVFRDPDIPEVLKDVTESLDELRSSGRTSTANEPLKIREKLLHKGFRPEGLDQMRRFPMARLTEYISARSQRGFDVSMFSYYRKTYLAAWRKAWVRMISCCPNREMYDLCKPIFGDELPDHVPLADSRFNPSLWDPSCAGMLELLFDMIEEAGNAQKLPSKMDDEWMTELFRISLLHYHAYELSGKKMFPDQLGQFVSLQSLSRDAVEAEELKEIAYCFRSVEEDCDILKMLLRKQIRLGDGWNLRPISDSDIASRISRAIQRIMAEGSLNDAAEEVQEACARLLAWLQEHPAETKKYFPEYSTEEQQARLVTSKAVVNLQRRSRDYERVLSLAGTDDIDEIERFIRLGMQMGQPIGDSLTGGFGGYNGMYGITYGDEFGGMDEAALNKALREIGIAGERYAFAQVRDALTQDGWRIIQEKPGDILFLRSREAGRLDQEHAALEAVQIGKEHALRNDEAVQPGQEHALREAEQGQTAVRDLTWLGQWLDAGSFFGRLRLEQPDTETYHQEGWDIRLSLWSESEGHVATVEPECYYIEVKTHTTGSKMRNMLSLSDSQLRLAISEGYRYAILMPDYDWILKKAQGMRWLPDIRTRISEGSISCTQDKYWFAMKAVLMEQKGCASSALEI